MNVRPSTLTVLNVLLAQWYQARLTIGFVFLVPSHTGAIAAPTSIAYQTPWRYHCDHALIIY